MDGLIHVWRAAEILVKRDAGLKERLKEAMAEFSVSLIQPGEWPKDLLIKAHKLQDQLSRIDQMDTLAAETAAKDLLSLAADVELALARQDRGE